MMKLPSLKPFLAPGLVLVFALYAVVINLPPIMKINPPDNHFTLLAQQFLRGRVELDPTNLPHGDVAQFYDRRDIYFGPFPAILLLPFVKLFSVDFPQFILGPISLAVVFCLAYILAKKFNFSASDCLWLAIFLVFSSVVLAAGLVPISAYLVQIIGVVFLLLSLLAYHTKKHPLVIGLCLVGAGMTRATLYFAFFFFLFEWIQKKVLLRQLILIALPVVLSVLLLGAYNHKRFRNPFESGYQYNQTHRNYPLKNNLRYGLASFNYLPTNLYSLLIKGPDPIVQKGSGFLLQFPFLEVSPWGLAIWYTSPLFLYLLFHLKKDSHTLSAGITSILLALPSLTFFSIGYIQYGYRYSLDFLPFLFLILLSSLRPKLSSVAKFLIVVGVVFNAIFLNSLWHIYPVLGINLP